MLKIENAAGGYINTLVLKNISFEVGDGELIGLTGLNGVGKSTTINEITGLLTPYQGQIPIDGLTSVQDQVECRKKIGFIPETPSLCEELTLREHLETIVMAYGLSYDEAMAYATELLELFRLFGKLEWFPINFSRGMKQKVMIICVFMVSPSLPVVDEPFLGLGLLTISNLTELLAQEKAKEKAILMSTYVLDTAEKTCDRFVILHQGQIRAAGALAELREAFGDETATLNDIYMSLTKEV